MLVGTLRTARSGGGSCTTLGLAITRNRGPKTMDLMSEQLAFTLAAAVVGLVSAVFFCIGNAFNSVEKITLQSTMFWDFSEPVARALAAQRAQYITGGLLLLAAFSLQLLAALASSTQPAVLPEALRTWPYLVLAVLLLTGAVAWFCCGCICRVTIGRVMRQQAHALASQAQHEGIHEPNSKA